MEPLPPRSSERGASPSDAAVIDEVDEEETEEKEETVSFNAWLMDILSSSGTGRICVFTTAQTSRAYTIKFYLKKGHLF